MPKIDLTNKIERMPAFEERLGIKLDSLSAIIDDDNSDSNRIEVMGEFYARSGGELDESIDLVLAVYDSEGRVIGNTSNYFSSDDFFGFETFEISTYVPFTNISKLRIYPKKS